MSKFVNLFALAVFLLFPATICEAQKLKIPNLLPFKKQTKEVTPYNLTDGSSGHANRSAFGRIPTPQLDQNANAGSKFKFPKLNLFKKPAGPQIQNAQNNMQNYGQAASQQAQGGLAGFNAKSKKFFSKLDSDLKKFGENTKRAFTDGWNPPQEKTAWWNQPPKGNASSSAMNDWMQQQAGRFSGNQPQPTNPYSVPRPRVANEYQNAQPRRRFQ